MRSRVTRTMSVAQVLRNNWSKRQVQLSEPSSTSLQLISPGLSWGALTTALLLISPGPANESLTSSWESSSPPSSWSRLDSAHTGVLYGYKYILFRQTPVILHNISILYSRVGVLNPVFNNLNAISKGKYNYLIIYDLKNIILPKMKITQIDTLRLFLSLGRADCCD